MRPKVASVFSSMHTSVVVASARMLAELKRYNYVTPTNFLELVKVSSNSLFDCRCLTRRLALSSGTGSVITLTSIKIYPPTENRRSTDIYFRNMSTRFVQYTEHLNENIHFVLEKIPAGSTDPSSMLSDRGRNNLDSIFTEIFLE